MVGTGVAGRGVLFFWGTLVADETGRVSFSTLTSVGAIVEARDALFSPFPNWFIAKTKTAIAPIPPNPIHNDFGITNLGLAEIGLTCLDNVFLAVLCTLCRSGYFGSIALTSPHLSNAS